MGMVYNRPHHASYPSALVYLQQAIRYSPQEDESVLFHTMAETLVRRAHITLYRMLDPSSTLSGSDW